MRSRSRSRSPRRKSPPRRSPPRRASPPRRRRSGSLERDRRGRDDSRERDRPRSRRSPSNDRGRRSSRGRSRSGSPPRRRREVNNLDEFGRVRPPPRSPSRSRSTSRSREGKRRERKERKEERRDRKPLPEESIEERKRKEKEYKASLWPPGSDLSKYAFDEALYWYVTPDKVWWYRPDLTLWYDCRNQSYFSYDAALTDYVSVDNETAMAALAEGKSVAPQDRAAAAAAAAAAELAAAEAAAAAAVEAAALKASEEEALKLAAEAKAQTEAAADDGDKAAAETQSTTEPGVSSRLGLEAEDEVAEALHSHTESWQGKKDSQEDRYIEGVRLGRLGTIYGVFDGHGGVQAAEYAGKHLPRNVARCYEQRASGRRETIDHKKLLLAMEDAYPLTDRELLQMARRKQFNDGTTALVMLVQGGAADALTLYLSHVGDCRAVLCRNGGAVRLTQDHRPDRKDEQKRIKEAGGGVFQVSGIWRCTTAAGAARALDARAGFKDGESHLYLSCSRSLGDPDLKLNADRPILSNVPEVSAHKLQEDDLFVVLGCDGVWDVLSDQQAVDLALQHWGRPADAAAAIVRTALSSGSGDNLTAQVVMFSWRAALGSAVADARSQQKLQEAEAARKPAAKPKIVEEDIDMFS